MSLNINSTGLHQSTPLRSLKTQASIPSFQAKKTSAPVEQPEVPVKKKSNGIVQGFKNFIASVKKIGVNISEYTAGTAKGIVTGGILGGVTYGGLNLVKATKALPAKAKGVIAGVVGLVSLGAALFKASLNVSQRSADIDHRYNTGHRVEK